MMDTQPLSDTERDARALAFADFFAGYDNAPSGSGNALRDAFHSGWNARVARGEQVVENVLRDACELPDRSSPEDQPDMLLITCEELSMLLRRHLGLEDAA